MTQKSGTSETGRDVVGIIGSIAVLAIMVAILVWVWFYGRAVGTGIIE